MPKSYKSFVKEYAMGFQVPATSFLKGVGSLNKGSSLRKKEDVKPGYHKMPDGTIMKGTKHKKEDVIPIPALTNATPLKKKETFKNKMGALRIDQKEK